MADGFIGHMREQVVIPPDEEIELADRRIAPAGTTPLDRRDFRTWTSPRCPFRSRPPGPCHFLVPHPDGMRNLTDPAIMHDYASKPIEKILKARDDIVEVDQDHNPGELLVVAYGTTARSAMAAVKEVRAQGIKAGWIRLKTIWPFPEAEIETAAAQASSVLVLENNTGQLLPYIKAAVGTRRPVEFMGPKLLGQIHDPDEVAARIKEAVS